MRGSHRADIPPHLATGSGRTWKIKIDDEAFAALYGHTSRPLEIKKGQKVAVRVISQYGEETTKILSA